MYSHLFCVCIICYLTVDSHFIFFIILSIAAVMQSDGFKYLKQNCPWLLVELLKTVGGCEEKFSGKRKYATMRGQSSGGDDTGARSVNKTEGSPSLREDTHSESVHQQ